MSAAANDQSSSSKAKDAQEEKGTCFAVQPLKSCPHLNQVHDVAAQKIDAKASCSACTEKGENWVCLNCWSVGCSRHVQGHAVKHWEESKHAIALSFADMSVWCYECEKYVNNEATQPARDAALKSKFADDLRSATKKIDEVTALIEDSMEYE